MKKVSRRNAILAWHFVGDDWLLAHDAKHLGRVESGQVYSIDSHEQVQLCYTGMHGSRICRDALNCAPGMVLCRTAHWGDVVEDANKLASRHREVLWVADVSAEIRLWDCWCARQVWHLLTDDSSRIAVETAEKFARGEATVDVLRVAWNAASDAYFDAACAWSAAIDAARFAAWCAASDAAWCAASDAFRSSARCAARRATTARSDAWHAQAAELERRMLALIVDGGGKDDY